jgi:hypothetical protein
MRQRQFDARLDFGGFAVAQAPFEQQLGQLLARRMRES